MNLPDLPNLPQRRSAGALTLPGQAMAWNGMTFLRIVIPLYLFV
jgi:hypothetical protein